MSNTPKYLEENTTPKEDQKLGKLDSYVDEGIFIGYSCKRKAYRCYNVR